MALNAVIALILCFSPNLTDFQANYITVVKDRLIMSVKYCILQCGLSAIAEHLVGRRNRREWEK